MVDHVEGTMPVIIGPITHFCGRPLCFRICICVLNGNNVVMQT